MPSDTTSHNDMLAKRARQQASVAELGRRALVSGDVDDLLKEAVRVAASAVDVPYALAYRALPDDEGLVIEATHGCDPAVLGMTVPPGTGSQGGYTLQSDEAVLVDDFSEEARFAKANLLGRQQAASSASVVIRGPAGAYGVLAVVATEPRAFSVDDVSFLRSVANVIGAAVHRRRAEEERTRLLEFLARASEVLLSSLNYPGTLGRLAHLAVPFLADWCAVDIIEDGGRPNRVVVAHTDAEKEEAGRTLRERYPVDSDAPAGAGAVIRTGEPELYPAVSSDELATAAADAEHLDLLRQLGVCSVIVVPLTARGRTLGAMTLVSSDEHRTYDTDDLALAEELARRAATAIDNARLFQERSEVTAALRQSLLPPTLPEIPGIDRYWCHLPLSETRIGGDFYDLFETADDTWTVAVGDVQGKDPEAAALTGLVRHTLRAVALHEPSPCVWLHHVNEALVNDESERFCTVLCGRFEVDPAKARARIWLASGGHPLPFVTRRSGVVERVGAPGTLLGVFEQAPCLDSVVELGPGDALVLFTDGVTEARREGEIFGDSRLAGVLASHVGKDAATICTAIEAAVVEWQPEHRNDDIAVVIIRVVP